MVTAVINSTRLETPNSEDSERTKDSGRQGLNKGSPKQQHGGRSVGVGDNGG